MWRRGRLGLKASWWMGTLDELPWPLLSPFMSCVLFHSQHCFQAQMEREACISVWETGWGDPKGPSLPVSAYGMFNVERRHCGSLFDCCSSH